MHGDITPNSVMFAMQQDGTSKGVLTGWHNAHRHGERFPYTAVCCLNLLERNQHSHTLQVTSQFMSLRLMMDPSLTPELIDEVESWFWSFVFSAIVYVGTKNETILMQGGDFFSSKPEKVTENGELAPLSYIHKKGYLDTELDKVEFACPAFTDIFRLFVRTWRDYYCYYVMSPESRGPKFDELTAKVSNPQWFLSQIEASRNRFDWIPRPIRGKPDPKDQISKNEQPLVAHTLRAMSLPGALPAPGKAPTRPTIVTAGGKTTQGLRHVRKAESVLSLVNVGTKRRAVDDLRAAAGRGDGDSGDHSLYPDVLGVPKAMATAADLARRANKLREGLQPQDQGSSSALDLEPSAPVSDVQHGQVPGSSIATAQEGSAPQSAPDPPSTSAEGLASTPPPQTPTRTRTQGNIFTQLFSLSPVKSPKLPKPGMKWRMNKKGK